MRHSSGIGPRVTRLEWGLLVALTLVAAALRLWRLDILPPGIHVDEAFNILDARAVIEGWRPIFLPANAGRDVLYTYLQAPLLAAFGSAAAPSIGPARLASALIGTLSIPIFWATARVLAVAMVDAASTNGDRTSTAYADLTLVAASDRTAATTPALEAPAVAFGTSCDPAADFTVRRIALLTAALTAFSYWHLHFSRFGIRAILFPPLVCMLVLAWWKLLEGERGLVHHPLPSRIPLGLLLGLAFYAHPAGRALVALPATHAAWLWWRDRDLRPARALAAAFALALLLAAPLLFFWWQHPETFTSHAGETSILGQGLGALAGNALKVIGMFFVAGDAAPWRNLPGRSVFGPILPPAGGGWSVGAVLASMGSAILVLGFVAGILRLRRALRAGQRWAGLLACWLLVLLLPSAVTDAAPNFSRAIGILPLPFLLVALGLESGLPKLAGLIGSRFTRSPSNHHRETGTLALSRIRDRLALALVTIALVTAGYDYFGRFAADDRSPLAFDDDKVALGKLVREERAAGVAVYLSPAMAAHPTVQLAAGEPLSGFDLQEGLVFPYSGIAEVVYPRLPGLDDDAGPGEVLGRLAQYLDLRNDSNAQMRGLLGQEGLAYAQTGFRIRPALELPAAPIADFDVTIRLRDWQSWPAAPTMSPGQRFELTSYWEALRPIERELNLTLQFVTAAGEGITQVDGPPLGGSYPTDRWQPGELVIELHEMRIPEDAPAGPAILRLGWYDWRDGSVLTDAEGRSVVEILRFEILR